MLGIDTKRDVITGEFAKKIWREVLSMWLMEKTAQTEVSFYNEKGIIESVSYSDFIKMGNQEIIGKKERIK